ncbi:AAA domain-containing protein [Paenibacillus nasutitermitis]|uniref:ATPase AAA n=1 Tax=Paenibacillus nasutitermitis TaxID=1652958 RepID=A0A917E2Y7_9BACL|nr:AAA domain-containing protein [Paenibacillus nasutitermitis]GGD99935.1 ATPase AAA [Paenibacillus nasutitermitis]
MGTNSTDAVRMRLTQIFKYLQGLNQIKNPVKKSIDDQHWKLWLSDLPKHEDIECRFLELGSEPDAEDSLDVLLKVRRPILTQCPEPPELIRDWLIPGWQKVENEPEIIGEKASSNEDAEQFEDDEDRFEWFDQWNNERTAWKLQELPARAASNIFESLYALNSTLEREQDQVELIVGDGILDWTVSESETIHHPILLQKVKLIFDPSVPEFTVIPIEVGGSFYSPLLQDMEHVSATTIKACTEELIRLPCTPLDHQIAGDYLKRVSSILSASGKFFAYGESRNQELDNHPVIIRKPVFFLRSRSHGFAQSLERILEHLDETTTFPEAVTSITGIDLRDRSTEETEAFQILDVNGDDEEVYFTKEANAEQLDIALKIKRYGSVLVQGPPGTGKTHTIANLIGHLLAEGKSILVTSHTSKALQVLRDKVAEPLQGLCVSVINEEIGNQQMDQSIDIISERLSSMTNASLNRNIETLEQMRKELLHEIHYINKDLRLTREYEYTPIVILGQSYQPIESAKLIAAEKNLLTLIPGDIRAGSSLPLQEKELTALYLSNKLLSYNDEMELQALKLPLHMLPTPQMFTALVEQYHELALKPRELHHPYWNSSIDIDLDSITTLLKESLVQVGKYSLDEKWKLVILSSGQLEEESMAVWKELMAEMGHLIELYNLAKSTCFRFEVVIPEDVIELQQLEGTLQEMIQFIRSNRKINMIQLVLRPKWSRASKQVQVNGASPSSLAHFEAVDIIVRHRLTRMSLMSRWNRQVTSIGGRSVESFGSEPELLLPQLKDQLQELINWDQTARNQIQKQWEEKGINWNQLMSSKPNELIPYSDLIHFKSNIEIDLPIIVDSLFNEKKLLEITHQLTSLTELLGQHATDSSRSINGLLSAVKNLDPTTYASMYDSLSEIWGKSQELQRRNEMLIKLESAAPNWAEAIRERDGVHASSEISVNWHKAWLIRQLDHELKRRQELSPEKLQTKLSDAREAFKRISVELVEQKAWLAVKRKTNLEQQMALQGWKLQMKRIGKATGSMAPFRLAEARKLMPLCQSAVPVWIMPINKVVESFDPFTNQFDVVIIDEASQADIMALTALYLGKQVIVVGDDNQVSPDAVGQKQMEVQKLIESTLIDIPNATLYDGQTSLYDLAGMTFAGKTQLREHFRCVEPIIQFSNSLSYNMAIKPLRDNSGVSRRPHTIAYRVEANTQSGKTNQVEAITITSLVMAAVEHESYEEATIGVISLLGEEQAILIDTILQRHMDPLEYRKRKIRCGNSAQFQGDERDVMFLSMVHVASGDGPLRMLSDPGERMKKRYNVAASRARDQMWLVYSLNESVELKDGDLRKRLIQHMINPYALTEKLKQAEPRLDSEFERQVMERLLNEGFHVVPQWKVGAYRIDLVVEGSGKRIAIECDGEQFHTSENLSQDISRQMILERLGWTFIRIRGSVYFRNPVKTMQDVCRALEDYGVTRDLHKQQEEHQIEDDCLKQQIIQRAEEMRKEWDAQPDIIYAERKTSQARKPKVAKREKVDISSEEKPEIPEMPEMPQQQTIDFDIDPPLIPGDLLSFLKQHNLQFIDKRSKGGALWVIGGQEIKSMLKPLISQGIKFSYLPKGSQSTNHKPGWFTKHGG